MEKPFLNSNFGIYRWKKFRVEEIYRMIGIFVWEIFSRMVYFPVFKKTTYMGPNTKVKRSN